MKDLFIEACELHARLNAKAYHYIVDLYAKAYSYQKQSETDPYISRIDRILGKCDRRIARRLRASREK